MRLLTYLVLALCMAGCGEVSYKRGGSQQEIEQAHRACRGSGDQLSACLEKHGWEKPKADQFDPLFATVSVTDNRQGTAPEPHVQSSPIIEVAPVAKKPLPANTTTAEMPAQEPAAADTAAQAARSTVNDGPDVTYSINSWWKMGGFPDQLKRDQLSCEKKLGPDYLPDYKTQTYKRAFVVCMHDLGWMAVRNLK